MSEPILPTHVSPPQQDQKQSLPGSYPETDKPISKARRKPKRRSTTLTIDSTMGPEKDVDISPMDGLFTSSPLSDNVPLSGSPSQSAPKAHPRARKSMRQRRSKKTRGISEESQGAWTQVSDQLGEHDEKMVRGWNEQIDTLLVFAGLFSAVITEFNNEAYQLLLPDPVDESKAILAHISFQLSRLPTAIRSGEAIPELQQPPPFQATQADVVVSTLWYSSLVCALIAASLGMLVKQWLQHYMKDDYAPTRERLRVRQLRFRGLCRWQVPAIIAFLPLLLRIALTLFLGGLIIFIHTLHPIVMWSVTSLIILWLASYCSSLVLPSVFADCPYKAPESLGFYIASRCWQDGFGDTVNRWISGYISWCDPEEFVKKDVAEDPHILATFDRTFSDHVLDTEVRECCRDMDEQSVMLCIDQVLRQRLQIRSNQDVWDDRDSEEIAQHRRITRKATEALINIVIDTMERSFDDETVIGMDERSWFGGAFQCIILLLGSTLWPSETALDTRLVGLLLRLKECATIPDADPYNMDSLHQDTQSFVLNLLSLRPSLFQKELVSFLPFLYGAASEHFSGRGSPEEMIKICRAILSIVVHMDPDVRDSDPWFKGFLVKWEVFMPNIASRIALLLPSKRFAVEHDIHCCRVKAAELGGTCIAEQLCARLEKALTENSRESGSNYSD